MSRIGKKVIQIPQGVTVEAKDDLVQIKGKLGSESLTLSKNISVKVDGAVLQVVKHGDDSDKKLSELHGLYRSLIANAMAGVSSGFDKELEIIGVGYRATQQGTNVMFQLGFSHNVTFTPPEGITIDVLEPTKLRVKGANKQKVGQVAADIRGLKPPEPYKGKGIRYKNEYVRKKAGKAGKK